MRAVFTVPEAVECDTRYAGACPGRLHLNVCGCGRIESIAGRKPGLRDDDVFYLFLQKQNLGAKLHIYLEEGTYPKRLFRGSSTNDMKK